MCLFMQPSMESERDTFHSGSLTPDTLRKSKRNSGMQRWVGRSCRLALYEPDGIRSDVTKMLVYTVETGFGVHVTHVIDIFSQACRLQRLDPPLTCGH